MARKICPVSFNLDDNYERDLFHYASQCKYFSKYVKRLIDRDMNGQTLPTQNNVPVIDLSNEEISERNANPQSFM